MSPRATPFAAGAATPVAALALIGGYLVWSVAFVVLYGLHGLACAFVSGDSTTVRLGLGAAWLAHVAAGLALVFWLRRRAATADAGTGRFMARVAITLAATGTVAIAWTGLPLLLTATCEPPPLAEARASAAACGAIQPSATAGTTAGI